ncbi:DUF3040 domain-containing protein [Kitasatospora sp. NPDC059571]|uniref:DUF3040 domain-containing protein n=1 Tax=Kitasatospora sp. NPDC059571 TaxID=3346871 RepID=UPI0036752C4E
MGALFSEHERLILDDIERRLRRQDPRLDRRLRRRAGVRALSWRPGLLAAAAGALAAACAAGLLWAAAGGRAALVPGLCAAAAAALGTAAAFRRLAAIQHARTGPRTRG